MPYGGPPHPFMTCLFQSILSVEIDGNFLSKFSVRFHHFLSLHIAILSLAQKLWVGNSSLSLLALSTLSCYFIYLFIFAYILICKALQCHLAKMSC